MFKEKKYQVIEKAISYELANFAFNYFLLKRDAVAWMHENNYVSEFTQDLVLGKTSRFLIPIPVMVICLWKH